MTPIRCVCEKCGLVLLVEESPRVFVPHGGPIEIDGTEARCPAHASSYFLWAELGGQKPPEVDVTPNDGLPPGLCVLDPPAACAALEVAIESGAWTHIEDKLARVTEYLRGLFGLAGPVAEGADNPGQPSLERVSDSGGGGLSAPPQGIDR